MYRPPRSGGGSEQPRQLPLDEQPMTVCDGVPPLSRKVLIIDTGAGECCFNNKDCFVPGSLIEPCGQKIVDAGGHAAHVRKLGRLRFKCKQTGHVLDSKKLWAWYVPDLACVRT